MVRRDADHGEHIGTAAQEHQSDSGVPVLVLDADTLQNREVSVEADRAVLENGCVTITILQLVGSCQSIRKLC